MFPNKPQSIGILATLLVIQVIITYYLSAKGIYWKAGDPNIYLITTTVSNVILWALALPLMKLSLKDLFHSNSNNARSIVLTTLIPIFLITLGLLIQVSNLYVLYTRLIPGQSSFSSYFENLFNGSLSSVIAICLAAPFFEEVLFRGIILRGLLSHYGSKEALVFSSILFSLFHLNPEQLLGALLLGYFLGWLYLKCRSLWPSIIAHSLFNSLAYFYSSSAPLNSELQFVPVQYQIGSILLIYLGFRLITAFLKSTDCQSQ